METKDTNDIKDILTFWFEETTSAQHYKKDDNFDQLIKDRFEMFYWNILGGSKESWRETPEGMLAEIIVLDQFSRNMFRGDKQSFAGDELALTCARNALDVDADEKFTQDRRQSFYMPFMHSESRDVHAEALKIFTEKSNEGGLKYEIMHKEIIDQFGRYPHRNEVMGRKSTPEEIEFLKNNKGF